MSDAASAAPKTIPAGAADQNHCLMSLRQYTHTMAKITRKPLLKSRSTVSKRGRNLPRPSAAAPKRNKPARKPVVKTGPALRAKKSVGALRRWTSAEVREAFSRFQKANPDPKGELEHLNPYTLLVAVVLSAQATDAGVNKATRALFEVADTPQKTLALGEEKLRDYIRTIGLYRNKAKNIIALSEELIEEFGGEVPRTRAGLESLPGAGRKTANVVLNMAYGERSEERRVGKECRAREARRR